MTEPILFFAALVGLFYVAIGAFVLLLTETTTRDLSPWRVIVAWPWFVYGMLQQKP